MPELNEKSELAPPKPPQTAPDSDWFLAGLVRTVTTVPVSFDITLQVAGFLVSGILVSGAHYFEAFGSAFANSYPVTDPETVAAVKQSFTQHKKLYEPGGAATHPDCQPGFIHLQGARLFHNSGSPIGGNEGIWWRGRLSEVTAFWLGALNHITSS